MNTLTIFYDAKCGLCSRFRDWLMKQPARVQIFFVPYDSADARRRFPRIMEVRGDKEIVVLADDGRWWQGAPAWLTCLWATREYHPWAFRLAEPSLLPLVHKAVHLLSENRLRLSSLLNLRCDASVAAAIRETPMPECREGVCAMPSLQGAKNLAKENSQTVNR